MGSPADKGEPLRGEAAEWFLRLQAAPEDATLRQDFEAWLAIGETHRRAWHSVQHAWKLSGDLPPPAGARGQTVVPLPRAGRSRRRGLGLSFAAMAACVALYFFGPIAVLQWKADFVTSVGELRDVTLEDGSIVNLDAGSAIAVNYRADRREVALLAGRAFFDVVAGRDRPFVVLVDGVTVTVVGTVFDVRSAGDGLTVSVRSGTVEVGVDLPGRQVERLAGGQRLSIDRQSWKVEQSRIAPEDVASWRERRLVVDGAPLSEVVEELDRHHRGFILVRDPALAARRVTGVFDLRHPVDALEAIARSQHASVIRVTSRVLLLSPEPVR